MKEKLPARSRLTYGNVVATVAVFIALGGSSYAVSTGSIDSREIKNNTIRSKDIRNNDVRSKDVRNQSLLAQDFAPGQLPAGATGATGPQGPPGPAGTDGGFSGATAGGDLTGTYPNPLVTANAIGSAEVQDNSLGGADVVESSLGKIPDADQLDGVDSSQFQRVGLVQAGAADETGGFADVIRWDQLAAIQTDGDADNDGTVRVLNTGSQVFTVRAPGGFTSTQSPGLSTSTFSVSGGPTSILIWSADGSRSWLVTCATESSFGGTRIRCHGVRNRVD